VPATLSVDLNEGGIHEVAVADSFETARNFAVELDNHGEAVHVHLHLDDDLSTVAHLDATNHYVEGHQRKRVPIDVRTLDEPVTGKLKVVTGYGAESSYVDVTVRPERPSKDPVEVDETLSKPPQREEGTDRPSLGAALARGSYKAIAGVGAVIVLAVALAAVVALNVDSPAVFLGTGVVIGVAIAAAVFALR
jgi:hypothetical protein